MTTAQEVIDTLVDLRRMRGWALFEVVSADNLYTEHIIKPEDCICDVMSKVCYSVYAHKQKGDIEIVSE